MAVTCLVRRASDDWIGRLRQSDDLAEVERLAFAGEETSEAAPPRPPAGLWARVFGRSGRNGAAPAPAPDDVLDLYKSWHGVHFLLTGSSEGGDWPMSFLVGGGTPVGDEISPVTVLTSEQVREVAAALSQVGPSDLRARFNPAEMEGQCIYPGGWEFEPEEETFQFLGERFEELKQFVTRTAEQRRGLIIRVE